jgi:Uma2 family endonuclease
MSIAVSRPLRLLTKEDYWALPDDGPRYQLIEGNLHMAPSPNRFHQDISRTILVEITKYLETHPIGILYHAPFDVVLTDVNVFQPDLAFFSEKRRRFLTDKGAEGAPDLVVEILSPSTAKLDLEKKRVVYARTGVDELWIVDPTVGEFWIYHLQKNSEVPEQILRIGDVIKTSLLPEWSIPVKKVFEHY